MARGTPPPPVDHYPLAPVEEPAPSLKKRSSGADVLAIEDVHQTVSVVTPHTHKGSAEEDEPVPFVLPEGTVHQSRFEPREEIAAGGMGTVHRVFDTVLRREVAMKVLRTKIEESMDSAAQFLAEAQLTAQLDHPNIVPVHDLGTDDGREKAFFTMKLVSGMTLAEVIASLRHGNATDDHLQRVLRVLLKVCDALEFAHGRGVVHCDLKPDNIMLGSHGQVYVMDWGVSVLKNTSDPKSPSTEPLPQLPWTRRREGVVGTPAYMAPEQALGLYEEIDERTDVYGLGGILYELLTGSPPNRGANAMAILSTAILGAVPPPEGKEIWEELPPGLCRITMRALARDRNERYQSVSELRKELEKFLDGGGWFATKTFVRGDIIVSEGEQADTAYVIERGHCQVFQITDGEQKTVGHLRPGDVFGETAALSTGVRTATVVAKDDVTVRMVTRASLEHELERNPLLGAFVRALAARFREATAKP